ncbi:MAG TPA: hemerythrin domain-containing protein, partial [Sandaracinaceae bacterium]
MIDLRKKHGRPPESTVELLLECHERIRRFTRLSRELVRAQASHEQIADAARSLCAYFGRAFLLHAEDEDRSIRPRLEAAGRLAAELEDVARQH